MYTKLLLSSVVALGLIGCNGGSGGSGSSDSTTVIATGQFKDSNVEGLSYVSGNQFGVTDEKGRFNYVVGQPITFSIGGVILGTAQGDDIIMPIDLVENGSVDNVQVQNIIRFLMMLDTDGDAVNGITISDPIRLVAAGWEQIDFSVADIATSLIGIISDVATANGRAHSLPAVNTAKTHMEDTIRCAYSGVFSGSYSGGDNGSFAFVVEPLSGDITGLSYGNVYDQLIYLENSTPIGYGKRDVAFAVGNTGSGKIFNGKLDSFDTLSGTWQNTGISIDGTFSGKRLGGVKTAKYRFSASYANEGFVGDYGMVSLDVDQSNNATGYAYSMKTNQTVALTGSLTDSGISVSATNGASLSASFNGGGSDTAKGIYAYAGSYNNGAEQIAVYGERCNLN